MLAFCVYCVFCYGGFVVMVVCVCVWLWLLVCCVLCGWLVVGGWCWCVYVGGFGGDGGCMWV